VKYVGVMLMAACWLWSANAARADGSLPPLPYRYLHPPAALAGGNESPTSAIRVIPADYLRAVTALAVFTPDAQAGISGGKGVIAVGRSAKAVDIRITPVDTPPGLPPQVAVDGNAYRISAVEQPGPGLARLTRPINLTLRWPHIPIGIYIYQAGGWRRVCYSDQAVVTTNTISCPIRSLGTVTAVTTPSNAGVPFPATPVSSGPFTWLNRYIALIAALGVIGLCLIAAYLVTRPDKGKAQ
jgi:hypothetical protein